MGEWTGGPLHGWAHEGVFSVKRKLLVLGMLVGTALAAPIPEAQAQVPTPRPTALPTARPSTTTPAPRAGGFPLELAFSLVGGGTAALGGGLYLLRRGKRA